MDRIAEAVERSSTKRLMERRTRGSSQAIPTRGRQRRNRPGYGVCQENQ